MDVVVVMDVDDKIRKIEDEIQKTPYNKATSHHIGKLKAKISKLKEEAITKGSSGTKGKGFHVKKSGDSTAVLVGFPSVGKSTLLNELTNADSKVGSYQFTTLDIIPGIMEYNGAQIQIFDVPGIITGASGGKGRGKEILSVARTADLILIVLDVFNPNHLDMIIKEIRDIGIRPNETPPDVTIKKSKVGGVHTSSTVPLTYLDEGTIRSILNEYGVHSGNVLIRDDVNMDQFIDAIEGNRMYIPSIVLLNKVDLVDDGYVEEIKKTISDFIPISADKKQNIDYLKEQIFAKVDLMRVYLKPQGRRADLEDPLIVRKNATVIDVASNLHREFAKNFRHANVWGTSVKFPGQKVGPNHVLEDEDILRIILKK
jgi:small GTP-binding protein